MEYKLMTCSVCGERKNIDTDFYPRRRKHIDGDVVRSTNSKCECKECAKKRVAAHYARKQAKKKEHTVL